MKNTQKTNKTKTHTQKKKTLPSFIRSLYGTGLTCLRCQIRNKVEGQVTLITFIIFIPFFLGGGGGFAYNSLLLLLKLYWVRASGNSYTQSVGDYILLNLFGELTNVDIMHREQGELEDLHPPPPPIPVDYGGTYARSLLSDIPYISRKTDGPFDGLFHMIQTTQNKNILHRICMSISTDY